MTYLMLIKGCALNCCILALGAASSASAQVMLDSTLRVNSLLDRRCQADAGQGQNSLVFTGRGGLPPTPAQIVRSDAGALTDIEFEEVSSDISSSLKNRPAEATDAAPSEPLTQVIEAQTWERNEAGQVVLMASQNSSYRPQPAHPCQPDTVSSLSDDNTP